MSLLSTLKIAGSAMNAQSQRLNTVASNLANADSVVGPDGQPYQAKKVIFKVAALAEGSGSGVAVDKVIEDNSPPEMVYDPKHPMADANGYVAMPNVNATEEMVDMISASRSYQNNVEVANATKNMLQKTLTIGQS